MKTFFFFGDSLTLGVNDIRGGWVNGFMRLAAEQGMPVPPSTVYNLGVRRHSSRQIRSRWKEEFLCRKISDASPYLVFSFGTVDAAAPNGTVVVPVEESGDNARAILSGAQNYAPVLMISPFPVRDAEHCERIRPVAAAYAEVCRELHVPYLDLFDNLQKDAEYMNDLSDGLHPGASGNDRIARAVVDMPTIREWIWIAEGVPFCS